MADSDPLLNLIKQGIPALYPLVRSLIAQDRIDFAGYSGNVPNGVAGLVELGKVLPEFVKREEMEKMQKPISREQEKFRRDLAYRINRNVFNMGKEEAREYADNKFSGSRMAAWLLGKATGSDKIFHNMEKAMHEAGIRPGTVAGARAKTHNRRIAETMSHITGTLLDPDKYDQTGNMDGAEISSIIPQAIRRGTFNDILKNNENWSGTRLRLEAQQKLEQKTLALGRAMGEATDSGLVSDSPARAWQELTQMFGRDPVNTLGPERFADTMTELDLRRRAAGLSKEEVRKLAPQLMREYRSSGQDPMAALGAMNTFMAMEGSTRGLKNIDRNFLMREVNDLVTNRAPLITGAYSLLSDKLGTERAEEVMDEMLSEPGNLDSNQEFINRLEGKVQGPIIGVDEQALVAHSKTPEARWYQSRAEYLKPMMEKKREEIENFTENLSEHIQNTVPSHKRDLMPDNVMKNRLAQKHYGVDFDQLQRYKEALGTGKDSYMSQYFKEMENRRRLAENVKNKPGGVRGVMGMQPGSDKGLGEVWESYKGEPPENIGNVPADTTGETEWTLTSPV